MDALCGGELFEQLRKQENGYILKKHALVTSLYNDEQFGILANNSFERKLSQLHSVQKIDSFVSPGEQLKQTVDLVTSPGEIMQISANLLEIEADYRAIRQMEASGDLYELMESDASEASQKGGF